MNTKKYIIRFAVGAAAFFIGHSAYVAGNYVYAGAKYLMSDASPHIAEKSHQEVGPPVEEVPTIGTPWVFDVETSRVFDDGEISGEYYLFDEALIKGFSDFDAIEITTVDDDGSPIPIRGAVHAKGEYKFTSVTLTRDRFTFETEAIRGISYRLVGKVDLAHPEEEGSGPVLRGTFKRLEKGRIVGSMYAIFYLGGC